MLILYVIIVLLIIIILLLSIGLLFFLKKSIYLSDKDKDFIKFVIDIYQEYSDDLGIQSKEQHEILVKELNKIKKKVLKS